MPKAVQKKQKSVAKKLDKKAGPKKSTGSVLKVKAKGNVGLGKTKDSVRPKAPKLGKKALEKIKF